MRVSVIAALCAVLGAAPAIAHADRTTSLELGISADMRQIGPTYSNGLSSVLGGAQLVAAFEPAPLPVQPPGGLASDARLVPELFAGCFVDRSHADGYAGAGVRGELYLSSHRRGRPMRAAIYLSARALLIGSFDSGAFEGALGEYFEISHGRRIGWESGTMFRPRADGTPGSREVDEVITLYYGWR